MGFNVPMSVDISRIIGLDTRRLDLFEAPLRQIDVAGSQIAIERNMPQPEACGKGPDFGPI